MSTNFYVRTPDTPPGDEGTHLGKYAAGHPFMFRAHPNLGVTDYTTWLVLAQSGQILTEYGTEVTVDHLIETIDDARRQWGRFSGRSYRDQFGDDCGNRFTTVEFC